MQDYPQNAHSSTTPSTDTGNNTHTKRQYRLVRRPRKANMGAHPNTAPKGNVVVNILIFLGFMFAIQLPTAIGAGLALYVAVSKQTQLSLFAVLFISYLVVTGLMVWLITFYYRKYGYERMQKLGWRDLGINMLYFVGLRIWVIICTVATAAIFHTDTSSNDQAIMKGINKLTHLSDPYVVIALATFLIHITFVGPYFEELTFRGIFKEMIFRRFSFWLPLLISSIIFALNHVPNNIIFFLLYGGMGAAFYCAYNRRHNIWDSYMVHALNNGLVSVAIIFALIFMK